mmetsp:Transcript_37766/g.56501  ORF Transcript_37766/g.56501 Transcript_37766/m.56501 type:complete len:213 (-) Transcript_37766:367-1005(-)
MFLRLTSLAIAVLSIASRIDAYVVAPQSVSTFSGRALIAAESQCRVTRGDLSMKKGKANVPPMMRGQYKKQQEMQNMRQQMQEAQAPGADGLPVFNLFVRTTKANMWYPCGSFKGDEKSAALASNYRDNGLLAGISKNQLDSGVSGSLYRDKDQLVESIVRGYPQLRKSRDSLEFGYKLAYEGLSEEQGKISVVKPEEKKGVFDNLKGMFSG